MKLLLPAAILMALMTIGCKDKTSPSQAQTSARMVDVQEEDTEMNAAMAKAQATLKNFISALTAPQPNQKYFLIKRKFTAGEIVEHLWVADPTFDGRTFRGVLANDPERIPGLTFKQPVEFPQDEVSDWMYVQDDKLVGGYTSRVLRSRMTAEERRAQDARNPYKFE